MQLKDFVAATLKDILQGIKEAQAAADGENINAEGGHIPEGKNAYSSGDLGTYTLVEFDVAVSAETIGSAGASLTVWGSGFKGDGQHTTGTANRISFAVPVRLPDGDKTRAQQITDRQKDRYNRRATAAPL